MTADQPISSHDPGASASSASTLLCWCNNVPVATYVSALAATPHADIYDIARRCGIGDKCTSCLADIEKIYVDYHSGRIVIAPDDTGAAAARATTASIRQRLWALIDRLSPGYAAKSTHLAPVLRGTDLATTVTLANSAYSRLDWKGVAARVTATVHDASGAVRHRCAATIEPGQRFDLAASDYLATPDKDDVAIGTCRLELKPIAKGAFGFLRPHFIVTTSHAAAAVHTQGAVGSLRTYLKTARGASDQRQSIFFMNCADAPVSATITVTPEDAAAPLTVGHATIPLSGCHLYRLPLPTVDFRRIFDVALTSDRAFKAYVLISDDALTRPSMDHL